MIPFWLITEIVQLTLGPLAVEILLLQNSSFFSLDKDILYVALARAAICICICT